MKFGKTVTSASAADDGGTPGARPIRGAPRTASLTRRPYASYAG
jgi:hypothetical protein